MDVSGSFPAAAVAAPISTPAVIAANCATTSKCPPYGPDRAFAAAQRFHEKPSSTLISMVNYVYYDDSSVSARQGTNVPFIYGDERPVYGDAC
jgi:hypothetical protein